MRAVLCPGQGARPHGPALDVVHRAREAVAAGAGEATAPLGDDLEQVAQALVDEACRVSGLDLRARLDAPPQKGAGAPTLGTDEAQPLTVLASLLSALGAGLLVPDEDGLLLPSDTAAGDLVAGHSLGALTALAVAGALTAHEVLHLAAVRGRAMQDCCTGPDGRPVGAMTAVVGGQREQVLTAVEEAGLSVANVNGASQVVASGTLDALARLTAPPRARLVPLDVAGPFHSPWMAGAAVPLADAVADLSARALVRGVVDDATGRVHPAGSSSRSLLDALVEHLTAPVRWDLVEASLRADGVDEVLVLAPSSALAGLARRGLRGTELTLLG